MRPRKFRVKTAKFMKMISQGLPLPLDILPKGKYKEGEDVTELLGIVHYETLTPEEKDVDRTKRSKLGKFFMRFAWYRKYFVKSFKGGFPQFLHKTDEERIQNFPNVLYELKGKPYYITTKLDGSSITFYYNNKKFGVCSRNLSIKKIKNNKYWKIVEKYNLEKKLKNFGQNIAFQGELVGPGIQKNHLNLSDLDVFVFNIYSIDDRRYMNMQEIIDICKKLEIPMVPIEEINQSFDYNDIESLLKRARGMYFGTSNKKEGIVIRSIPESYSSIMHKRLSFKVLNNDFLLENE